MGEPQPAGWTPDADDLAILELVSRGLTNESVARQLRISERTVRRKVRAIGEELGVDTTVEAVVWAVREGLI